MRRVVPDFDLFTVPVLPHEHARDLEGIDEILGAHPRIAELIWKDLQGDRARGTGRPGLSAEQVLRAALIKQMNGFSYVGLPSRGLAQLHALLRLHASARGSP